VSIVHGSNRITSVDECSSRWLRSTGSTTAASRRCCRGTAEGSVTSESSESGVGGAELSCGATETGTPVVAGSAWRLHLPMRKSSTSTNSAMEATRRPAVGPVLARRRFGQGGAAGNHSPGTSSGARGCPTTTKSWSTSSEVAGVFQIVRDAEPRSATSFAAVGGRRWATTDGTRRAGGRPGRL
jgi:hypothetical protein